MKTRAYAAVLCLVALGCGPESRNPFARLSATVAVSADADLLVASNLHDTSLGDREVFALDIDSGAFERATNCTVERRCDTIEALRAPDGNRFAMRRVLDLDGDGRLDASTDGVAVVVVVNDLQVESAIIPAPARVSGFDWSFAEEILVYSGQIVIPQDTEREDLFVVEPAGTNNQNLTATELLRERRPRIDPTGTRVVHERLEIIGGTSEIWLRFPFALQLTEGGAPDGPRLGESIYLQGSDADPVFSPDSNRVVFRRLTALGNGGLGSWDILTVDIRGEFDIQTVASGPEFRGPPDWSDRGIAFVETDVAAGVSRVVVIEPDGGDRRVPFETPSSNVISNPRWLHPPVIP